MNLFFLNCFIALGYVGVQGNFTLTGLWVGFALGYAALWMTQPLYGRAAYFRRVPKLLKLMGYFILDLLWSNMQVLWEVMTPRHISRPGIVGIPLEVTSEIEILLFANMISLTPGTLSVDLSHDRKIIYVHVMFLDDPKKFRQKIKAGLERRILEVTR